MTDAQVEETQNTTDLGPLKYKAGDTIAAKRGSKAGQPATVLGADPNSRTYAVQYANGSLTTIPEASVKEPEEASVTAAQLAEAFGNYAGEVPNEVWERLESLAPGITEKVRLVQV